MELREGIVVKSQKYQENSKLITIVNSEGKETYLVRGASNLKSKNYAYSQELTKIAYDANQSKNSFHILKSGKVLNNYTRIKSDLQKINDSLLIMEASYLLGNHLEDYSTFYQFLNDILENLNNQEYHPYYLFIFQVKLLYLLGIGPIFSKCTECGRRDQLIGFDFLRGGMKCAKCDSFSNVYYNQEVIEILRYLYLTKLEEISFEDLNKLPNQVTEIYNFLNRYYEHFLGYQSRALKIIKKISPHQR
jgi:DNA repair protein RecO (recombination protein O)